MAQVLAKERQYASFLKEMFYSLKKGDNTQIEQIEWESDISPIRFRRMIKPFVHIPAWIIRVLSSCPPALTLYMLLLSFDRGKGRATQTIRTLLSITGFNRRTFYTVIKLLENIGLVKRERNNGKTGTIEYILLDNDPKRIAAIMRCLYARERLEKKQEEPVVPLQSEQLVPAKGNNLFPPVGTNTIVESKVEFKVESNNINSENSPDKPKTIYRTLLERIKNSKPPACISKRAFDLSSIEPKNIYSENSSNEPKTIYGILLKMIKESKLAFIDREALSIERTLKQKILEKA